MASKFQSSRLFSLSACARKDSLERGFRGAPIPHNVQSFLLLSLVFLFFSFLFLFPLAIITLANAVLAEIFRYAPYFSAARRSRRVNLNERAAARYNQVLTSRMSQFNPRKRERKKDLPLHLRGGAGFPISAAMLYTRMQIALWTTIMGYCSKVSVDTRSLKPRRRKQRRAG